MSGRMYVCMYAYHIYIYICICIYISHRPPVPCPVRTYLPAGRRAVTSQSVARIAQTQAAPLAGSIYGRLSPDTRRGAPAGDKR